MMIQKRETYLIYSTKNEGFTNKKSVQIPLKTCFFCSVEVMFPMFSHLLGEHLHKGPKDFCLRRDLQGLRQQEIQDELGYLALPRRDIMGPVRSTVWAMKTQG